MQAVCFRAAARSELCGGGGFLSRCVVLEGQVTSFFACATQGLEFSSHLVVLAKLRFLDT